MARRPCIVEMQKQKMVPLADVSDMGTNYKSSGQEFTSGGFVERNVIISGFVGSRLDKNPDEAKLDRRLSYKFIL